MGVIGDIYQLSHKYRDQDNKALQNVYFYRREANAVSGTPSYAQQLAMAWNTDVLTPALATMPTFHTSYSIDVINLFDHSEQYSLAISRAGTRSSTVEVMPTFVNAVATLSVDNGLVRKGRKSFPGLQEADQAGGVLTAGGVTVMAIRAALCLVNLVGAVIAGYVFRPVVVRRWKDSSVTPPRYELPTSIGEAVYGYVTSAIISTIVSSQNSRKD